jgi:ABC-type transport system substrate-binding protein
MKDIRSRHLLLTVILPCVFLLIQCSDQEKPTDAKHNQTIQHPRSGGVYRTPLLNNPTTLDPASVEDIYGISVVDQIYDGLVKFSPDLLIIPALAENWQIAENGKAYHFFLQPGARFHNGQPVSAHDVIFSLQRLLRTQPAPTILPHLLRIIGAREYSNHQTDQLDGLFAVNDREVLIRLEEPYAPFLAALGMHQAKVVPYQEVLHRGEGFSREPVGSGPFRLVSRDSRHIRLERFADYYAGAAYLDEIHYVIYPGGKIEEVLADFQNHQLEDMPVYGKARQELAAQQGLQWIHRPSLSLLFYGINCAHPQLRNTELRKALSMAVNRQRLAATVYEGQFEVARGILPPGMPGYNPESQTLVDDPVQAKDHLQQALREKISLATPVEIVSAVQSPLARAELEFVRDCWASLGITLEVKFIPDWTKFEEYLKSEALQIYRYAWFADIPDPDNFFQVLFGSDSNLNYMHYQNEAVDRLLRQARTLLQLTERAEVYHRIEKAILEAQPLIPLVHLSIDHVYRPNVHGIHLNALGDHAASFYQVWLDPA